jgi:hypothetical protein
VLKGIEELKAKGFKPDQMQEKILELVELHLKARVHAHACRPDPPSRLAAAPGAPGSTRRRAIPGSTHPPGLTRPPTHPPTYPLPPPTHLVVLVQGATREESRRRDVVSHHVLRLAYCRTDDLRRWLLALECDLFRARFRALLPDEQKSFMEVNALPFTPIS